MLSGISFFLYRMETVILISKLWLHEIMNKVACPFAAVAHCMLLYCISVHSLLPSGVSVAQLLSGPFA